MVLTMIGVGNASSFLNYNQSILLEEGKSKMLIDCGSMIPQALHDAGINFRDITHYYVSHPHGDHVGGFENLVFLFIGQMPTQRNILVRIAVHYQVNNFNLLVKPKAGILQQLVLVEILNHK